MQAVGRQIGGSHYTKMKIQPFEFTAANNWDAFAHTVLKYVSRWRDKGGVQDVEKAYHVAQLRMELQMEHYHPHVKKRPSITMNEYIRQNQIPPDDEPVLLALELWVRSSGQSHRIRAMFFTALENYIEATRAGTISTGE